MKIIRKLLTVIVAAVLILVIVAVVAVHFFAGRAVKIGIETAATKTLNVGVSVDDVDLSIMGGKLALQNLVISNPPGYQHDNLLELNNAEIEVNLRSLLGDVVKIKQIKLDGAQVVLEQRGITSNNIQDVIKAIPRSPEGEPAGKKLHIDNLEITNTKVKVKLLPVPGKVDTLTMELAPIRMTNLGTDDKLDTAALTGKILSAIVHGIAEQGAGILPADIVNSLSATLGKTIDLGKDVIKSGTDIGKDLIKGTEDIRKGITEGLKGLTKPKKKDD